MNKPIFRLAIPNIVSNISVPLLGAVDTAIVGHLESVYYLGALAIGGMIFNFLFWGFGFLRMGTTGLTAQAYGGKNRPEIILILARVLAVAGTLGMLLILLQQPLIDLSFFLVESSPEVETYTRVYFDIRIWTAPAVLALYGLNGWFLGMQNAKYPMAVTIVLNLLNILLNLWFVYGMGMDVDGVALGTVISTYLALLLAVGLFIRRYRPVTAHFLRSRFLDIGEIRKFFTVNRDIFIRTLCLIFAFSFFTAKSSEQGDVILAANTILLQLWMIASYGIDGFAYAAESLVGRFKGALDRIRLKQVVYWNLFWGLTLGAAASLVYLLFDRQILNLFTDQTPVIEHAATVIGWTILAPLVSSICYIWDGVYIGATETVPMRNTMLMATLLIFLPAWYIGTPLIGVHALWLAMVLFMVSRGVLLTIAAPRYIFGSEKRSGDLPARY